MPEHNRMAKASGIKHNASIIGKIFVQSTISNSPRTLTFCSYTCEPFSEFTCTVIVLMNNLMNALIKIIIGITMYYGLL